MRGRGAPKFWTEERLQELRRLYNLQWEMAAIAAYFGKSKHAIACVASRHRISSKLRQAMLHKQRSKSRGHSKEVRKFLAEKMRQRHQEPGYTRKLLEAMTAPECRQRGYDTKRGFPVPDHMKDDFVFLTKKLKSAQEAGRVLGLIEGNP